MSSNCFGKIGSVGAISLLLLLFASDDCRGGLDGY